VSPADGVRRIGAVRAVRGYPLMVGVGVDRGAVLASWRRETIVQGAYAAVATTALLVLGAMALRRAERDRRNAEELERRVGERTVQLRDAVAARDMLLKELNHRVKNNLQLVIGLLKLQAAQRRGPAVDELVEQACRRIAAIAEVHASLYQGEQVGRLDAGAYLDDLCHRLAASFLERERGRVALEVDARPLWLKVDQAIPLGLIVNELVTNAFKHAFAGGGTGTVRVAFGPAPGGGWRLEVADDGRGAAEGVAASDRPGGLGSQLVDGFARQLGGTVQVEPAPSYQVRIEFPFVAEA
jgi:two-component system, sensor histidine kinase PdtaS